jgi:hypothetical protein
MSFRRERSDQRNLLPQQHCAIVRYSEEISLRCLHSPAARCGMTFKTLRARAEQAPQPYKEELATRTCHGRSRHLNFVLTRQGQFLAGDLWRNRRHLLLVNQRRVTPAQRH